MAGRINRRDDDALVLSSTNVFAALGSLKKKKKKMMIKTTAKKKSSGEASREAQEQVFWAPAPLNAKSWADVVDDDDDYVAAVLPERTWSRPGEPKAEDESESEASLEEVGLLGFMYIGAVDMCNLTSSLLLRLFLYVVIISTEIMLLGSRVIIRIPRGVAFVVNITV